MTVSLLGTIGGAGAFVMGSLNVLVWAILMTDMQIPSTLIRLEGIVIFTALHAVISAAFYWVARECWQYGESPGGSMKEGGGGGGVLPELCPCRSCMEAGAGPYTQVGPSSAKAPM